MDEVRVVQMLTRYLSEKFGRDLYAGIAIDEWPLLDEFLGARDGILRRSRMLQQLSIAHSELCKELSKRNRQDARRAQAAFTGILKGFIDRRES